MSTKKLLMWVLVAFITSLNFDFARAAGQIRTAAVFGLLHLVAFLIVLFQIVKALVNIINDDDHWTP